MTGIRSLRKLQVGKESTGAVGTAVAATALLRYNGTMQDMTEVVFDEEDVGYLSGLQRTHIAKTGAELQIEGIATFEQLPYILDGGVHINAGAADGAGSGFVYSYVFPTIAQPELRTYTIEGGDNQDMLKANYCFVKEFSLSGAAGDVWNLSATFVGQKITTTDAFTASSDVAITAVEDMIFGKTKLYLDDSTGTIGSTLKSATLLGATLNVNTGNMEVYTADGEKHFNFVKTVGSEITLEVTFEHNATANAEFDAWRAQTPRQIRLLIEGSALTSAGTTYTYKTAIIDLAGTWETFSKLDEQDGNDIVTGTFRARYDATAELFAEIVVVNQLSALP